MIGNLNLSGCSYSVVRTDGSTLSIFAYLFAFGYLRPARSQDVGSFSCSTLNVEVVVGYMRLAVPKRTRICAGGRHFSRNDGW